MAKQRRLAEELYLTVPSLYRCPISMDVMRSPVSLCTGVTYDRSSIERWLALGHNTCPATMQTLPSTSTTPNLNLRRLIDLWISQAEAARTSRIEVSKQVASDVISGAAGLDSDSLENVIDFMKDSWDNTKLVAQSRGFVVRLVDALAKASEIRISELIVAVLDPILQEDGVKELLNELILENGDCLSSFISVLQKGAVESKIRTAKILEFLAANPESRRKIEEKQGLLHELYNLSTAESNSSAVEAGLSSLLAISTTRPAKKDLIRLGIVGTVGTILSGYENAVRAVTEKALGVLEQIATCTEGRGAIGADERCLAGIVRSLMKCSGEATEHGVAVLWSLLCLGRDCAAAETVVQVNGLTKVLLVMQSDCTLGTRKMCVDLVKVLRGKQGKSNLAPYETRTTHITPY
ncbi:U-box domain-containing protein 27-like [Dorcoceras hygrometricum]|uniref:U-box domain-containing protein n=1 Tax=Dorcoceras hygrometricum TaxID=472368 RepID=A0A2Z7DGL2_9LAMI|nr:U-box domain-containing protein 27-like [Dorcoceras hygrometricum]